MTAGEFSGIGFAPGVVRGARSFRVDTMGRLTGVNYKQVWRPGENSAECRKSEDSYTRLFVDIQRMLGGTVPAHYIGSGGYVPSSRNFISAHTDRSTLPSIEADVKWDKPHSLVECQCGFYAYYDGSDDYHQQGYVSGVVEGYGEALIGTRGFRAMKARIVALYIPKHVNVHLARLVARNYPDVPLFTSFDDMVTEFPPDGGNAERTPDTDPEFWTRTI